MIEKSLIEENKRILISHKIDYSKKENIKNIKCYLDNITNHDYTIKIIEKIKEKIKYKDICKNKELVIIVGCNNDEVSDQLGKDFEKSIHDEFFLNKSFKGKIIIIKTFASHGTSYDGKKYMDYKSNFKPETDFIVFTENNITPYKSYKIYDY